MGEKMDNNLWEQVGNECLNKAGKFLQMKNVLDLEQARTVKELVDTAIAIELLNLRRAEQNRFGAAVLRGQTSSLKVTKN